MMLIGVDQMWVTEQDEIIKKDTTHSPAVKQVED